MTGFCINLPARVGRNVARAALAILAAVLPLAAACAQDESLLDRKSSGALAAPEQQVLAEGDPPLTEALVDRIAGFVTFCFEIPLTPADRDHFRTILTGEWRRNDRAAMEQDLQMAQTAEQLARLDPAKRELFRQANLPNLLADARKRAKTDPDMRWLVGRYDEEHRPLTKGSPALTRQSAGAFAELISFMVGEARGQNLEATPDFKREIAQTLTRQWPTLTMESRKQVAGMPLTLAQLRAAWAEAPADQKQKARALWRQQFGNGQVAKTGGQPKQPNDPTGAKAFSAYISRETNKHIGNMIILSNPAFYH